MAAGVLTLLMKMAMAFATTVAPAYTAKRTAVEVLTSSMKMVMAFAITSAPARAVRDEDGWQAVMPLLNLSQNSHT
jgi:hypothetical protein